MAEATRSKVMEENLKKTNERLDLLSTEFSVLKADVSGMKGTLDQILAHLQKDQPTPPSLQQQLQGTTLPGPSEDLNAVPPQGAAITGTSVFIPGNKSVRIDVSLFDGTELENWLFKLDLYFACCAIPVEQKLSIACMHLTGAAMTWYRWMFRHGKLLGWQNFMTEVRHRFGPSSFEDFRGQLSKLSQLGTVAEFIAAFESLSDQVPDVHETMLMSMFISGLKPEIKRELLLAKPHSLFFAFELARAQEAKFNELRGAMKTFSYNKPIMSAANASGTGSHQRATPSPMVTIVPAREPSRTPQRRMSPTELEKRKEKGICFNCDEKWWKGHICKHQFNILIIPDELSVDELQEEECQEEEQPPAVGFHKLMVGPESKSLRFEGLCEGTKVEILWDSGSSANFIQFTVAKKLQLTQLACRPFEVQTGGGAMLPCNSFCKAVTLSIQGNEFKLDFFVIDLQGAELVLGMQLFEQLGEIVTNFKARTVKFSWEGNWVELVGKQPQCPDEISVQKLCKL